MYSSSLPLRACIWLDCMFFSSLLLDVQAVLIMLQQLMVYVVTATVPDRIKWSCFLCISAGGTANTTLSESH